MGYLRGLLLAEGRKSIEPIALMFGGRSEVEPEIAQSIVLSWQRLLTVSPWVAQAVQQEIQAVFNEEFVPSARVGDRQRGRDGRIRCCPNRGCMSTSRRVPASRCLSTAGPVTCRRWAPPRT